MRYWWPTLAWAGIIFWLSSRPTLTTSEIYWQDFVIKKAAHLFVYAVLASLLYRSLKHTTKLDRLTLVVLTLSIVVLYAISDEFHQSFIPGREPRLLDILIDFLGASGGLWLIDKRGIIAR